MPSLMNIRAAFPYSAKEGMKQKTNILVKRVIKMKLVPHLGWKRTCFFTFATVSSSCASRQAMVLCSAP